MAKYRVKIDDSISNDLYTLDELLEEGFLDSYDKEIKIKQDSDQDWVVARDYPFSQTESDGVYTINEDGSVTRNVTNMANYSLNEDGSINRSGNYHRPRKPDSNMVWAIISITICLPFGILALVESVKVDSLYSDGNVDGAIRASENAKKWAMWSIYAWIGIIGFVIIAAIAGS